MHAQRCRRSQPQASLGAILIRVARPFIDLSNEAPALRRAAVLLERVRQDGGRRDPDLEELQAGIDAMRRAAAAGRQVHDSAIGRIEAVLARVEMPARCSHDDSVYDLLRCNALVETREIVRRVTRVEARVKLADLAHAAT